MVILNSVFAQSQECTNHQVPAQMNRYTVHTKEITEKQRGRGALYPQKDPRRRKKDQLWKRICRYMKCRLGAPELPGREPWQKTRFSGVMNLVM